MQSDLKNLDNEAASEMVNTPHLQMQDRYYGVATSHPERLLRPLAQTKVPAGFPSPADDYMETQLDLNEFFVSHPSATFYWKVSGESMNLAGILDGCYLLVDRSLEAFNNDIVLATINGEVTVKRFVKANGYYELRPESSHGGFKTIRFKRSADVEIWGVVSAAFNKYR